MKKTFYIGEIADFFQIPASTLRFWESKGLFTPQKKSGSQYREYSLPDLMKISDIIFYKNLGIPLKNINELKQKSILEQTDFCFQHLEQLHQQQKFLDRQIQRLNQHQQALSAIKHLEERPFEYEEIDTDCIVTFELTEIEKLKMYIDNPYLYSRVQHSDSPLEEYRGITIPAHLAVQEQILWKKTSHKYLVCLMKEEIAENYPNNLSSILAEVHKTCSTGYIISRFLASACESGKIYDFYKTYIEIL